MRLKRRARTDFGTVLHHWLAVFAILWLIGTGLRLASDDPALRWLMMFDEFLPVTQLWFGHIASGYVLTAVAASYAVYVAAAGLSQRIRSDGVRLKGLFASSRTRWGAVNAILYWVFFAAMVAAIVSGWLLLVGVAPCFTYRSTSPVPPVVVKVRVVWPDGTVSL